MIEPLAVWQLERLVATSDDPIVRDLARTALFYATGSGSPADCGPVPRPSQEETE